MVYLASRKNFFSDYLKYNSSHVPYGFNKKTVVISSLFSCRESVLRCWSTIAVENGEVTLYIT